VDSNTQVNNLFPKCPILGITYCVKVPEIKFHQTYFEARILTAKSMF